MEKFGGINIKYNGICPFCGCHYLYQQEDVAWDCLYNFSSVQCPYCKANNIAEILNTYNKIGGFHFNGR